jgi:hypothetical protein
MVSRQYIINRDRCDTLKLVINNPLTITISKESIIPALSSFENKYYLVTAICGICTIKTAGPE